MDIVKQAIESEGGTSTKLAVMAFDPGTNVTGDKELIEPCGENIEIFVPAPNELFTVKVSL